MKKDNADTAFIAVLIMFMMSIVFVILLFLSTVSHASDMPEISLCWDAPTQRVDGTPLTPGELASYEIEHSAGDGLALYTAPGTATEFAHTLQDFGQNCFRVRVYDTNGLDSAWTEQVCMTVLAPPAMIKFRQCS